LFVNSYGGRKGWEKIKQGLLPGHHLWGCMQLVRMGYEVAIAEPLPHFAFGRRALPHDLRLLRSAYDWLRKDDIIYCGHTLLYWLPLLKTLGTLRRHIVSLTYARETLDFCGAHSGIVALTPAAADQARKMAPKAKVAHLAWGVEPSFFPVLTFSPRWFLSCGRTHRDHSTLSAAASLCQEPIRVIAPSLPSGLSWPPNVSITTGGIDDTTVTYEELLHDYYAQSAGSLIILQPDPLEKTAVGFTNLLEAMAMGRPVIVTRSGALAGELDVERAECGLHVPAGDPAALASAIASLVADPARAKAMGEKGRQLCASHYNINRFARDLHHFFESL
jgi:glycosyltransferase involved in cell wall biosynthesis